MGKRKTILDIHKDGWRTHLKMIKFGCHQKLVWKRPPPESWSIVSPFEQNSTRAGATKLATVVVTSAPLPGHARHQRVGSCCTSTQKPNSTPSKKAAQSVHVRSRTVRHGPSPVDLYLLSPKS